MSLLKNNELIKKRMSLLNRQSQNLTAPRRAGEMLDSDESAVGKASGRNEKSDADQARQRQTPARFFHSRRSFTAEIRLERSGAEVAGNSFEAGFINIAENSFEANFINHKL